MSNPKTGVQPSGAGECMWDAQLTPSQCRINPCNNALCLFSSDFCKQHLAERAVGTHIISKHTGLISFCCSAYFIRLSYFGKVCPEWCFLFSHMLQLQMQAGLCHRRNVLLNFFKIFIYEEVLSPSFLIFYSTSSSKYLLRRTSTASYLHRQLGHREVYLSFLFRLCMVLQRSHMLLLGLEGFRFK